MPWLNYVETGDILPGEVLVLSRGDFSEWLRLLVMESYENIKKDYLDNSKPRALKYEILIKYFKEYGWDIQAAGNKYRTEFNKYKASLPSED